MALINCPECGKEVSDKSQICVHCGYPLEKFNNISENVINNSIYNKINITNKVKSKYLNRDCWVLYINDKNNVFSQESYIELYDDYNVILSDVRINQINLVGQMKEIYIWKNNKIEFSQIKQIKLIDDVTQNKKDQQLKRANSINHTKQVKCPKCGSTQIQMVPRKWSIWTGLLTNKVDRVCINCKNKF